MATHEQTYLGPVFDELQTMGLIEIAEDENSYGIAAEFASLASGAGVVIHADEACDMCAEDETTGLDAAWADAEAALPEGWFLRGVTTMPVEDWTATAHGPRMHLNAQGPTPAAALRALAAKLRERAG